METINCSDFERIELRVGTVVEALPFPEARKPAWKLRVDFGAEIGIKQSSAQVTAHYAANELVGRQVLAVLNFPRKQIGTFFSDVLVTGVYDQEGRVVLVQPDRPVPNGARLV